MSQERAMSQDKAISYPSYQHIAILKILILILLLALSSQLKA